MQDPYSSEFPTMKQPPPFPEQEQLNCPRCESSNTKFCYYNNYNLSQPRFLCKDCRRYWTKGGVLRNIPVGGGIRKNATKRSSNHKRANPDPAPDSLRAAAELPSPPSSSSSASAAPAPSSESTVTGKVNDPTRVYGLEADEKRKLVEVEGWSLSSLLGSNSLLGGVRRSGSGEDLNSGLGMRPGREMEFEERGRDEGGSGDGYLQGGEWENNNRNRWPES